MELELSINPEEYYNKYKKLCPEFNEQTLQKIAVYLVNVSGDEAYILEYPDESNNFIVNHTRCIRATLLEDDIIELFEKFLNNYYSHNDEAGLYLSEKIEKYLINNGKKHINRNKLYQLFKNDNFYHIKFHNSDYYFNAADPNL